MTEPTQMPPIGANLHQNIIVVDDHDAPEVYVGTDKGHYEVERAYTTDAGQLVVVLNYHDLFLRIRDDVRQAAIVHQRATNQGREQE
jgi:hypothetical protein